MLKLLQVFLLLVAAIAALIGGGLFHFWLFLHQPGSPALESKVITVAPGLPVREIAQRLAADGLLSDPLLFRILSRLHRADQNLQAGEYLLTTTMTPEQVLAILETGKVIFYRVTFPEGSTLEDVARILAEARLADRESLLFWMHNAEFARSLGLDADSLEGYLFPNTYHFVRSQSPTAILREMVKQFQRQVEPRWRQRPAAEPNLSLHQTVILASLVEKEAVSAAERPIIAAVFRNRLRLGMKLQSDPTAVYDLAGFSGAVTGDHLKRDSRYNTYLYRGLPPGPICNPGLASLAAAMTGTAVPYLYFVSNLDGTHTFSETLAEHQLAVREYRRKLERE